MSKPLLAVRSLPSLSPSDVHGFGAGNPSSSVPAAISEGEQMVNENMKGVSEGGVHPNERESHASNRSLLPTHLTKRTTGNRFRGLAAVGGSRR